MNNELAAWRRFIKAYWGGMMVKPSAPNISAASGHSKPISSIGSSAENGSLAESVQTVVGG
ncbi:MAG: hypothetical protein H6651_14710 [Ardenticatenales bacterium]|nr:hypothetical protein [Ardenticatenales bacterium]